MYMLKSRIPVLVSSGPQNLSSCGSSRFGP